jgi:hypothetical protein
MWEAEEVRNPVKVVKVGESGGVRHGVKMAAQVS